MKPGRSKDYPSPTASRRRRLAGKEFQAFLERPNALRAFARLEGGRRISAGTVRRLVTVVERPQIHLPDGLEDETYVIILFEERGDVRRQVKRFILPGTSRRASAEFELAFDHAGHYTVRLDLLYGIDVVCQLAIKIRVDAGKQISQSA